MKSVLNREFIEPAPSWTNTDFGCYRFANPQFLVSPRNIDEVREVVEYANRQGARIVCRGNGCSNGGQTLGDDLILGTAGLSQCTMLEQNVAVAEPGVTWDRFQGVLTARQRTSPVVVSNKNATLGGTLSVGGFGPTSSHCGAFVESVLGIDVVTGDGDVVHARPQGPHSDLFKFTMCGLGQTGIVVRVFVKTRRYRPFLAVRRRRFPESVELSSIMKAISPGEVEFVRLVFDNANPGWCLEAGCFQDDDRLPHGFDSVVRDEFRATFLREEGFSEKVTRRLLTSGALSDVNDCVKLWSDFFLPITQVDAFVRTMQAQFLQANTFIGINSIVIVRNERDSRFLPLLPLPDERIIQSIGYYCFVPRNRTKEYVRLFERGGKVCHQLGGRQYLYGYFPRNRAFFEEQYGSDVMSQWDKVKQAYDSKGIFGVSLF